MTSDSGVPSRPTMRDVAKQAGVSVMTVSRVVNNDLTVTPATRARVQDAISRLGYRRNSLARGLRPNQSSGLIGLLVANLANPFYSHLAVAVERRAREQGYALIIANTSENADREDELTEDLLSRGVDGLLMVPTGDGYGHLAKEVERGTAVVFVTRPPSGLAVDTAVLDDFGGAREAVSALAAGGHRRIAYLGHPAHTHTARERLRGYRAALEAAGVDFDAQLVHEDLDGPASTELVASALLTGAGAPTALFTTNNQLTMGGLRAIRTLGGGVDLAGFDDLDFGNLVDLPFTVVSYDAEELGRVSADLIIRRMRGQTGPPQRRIIPTRLVQRGHLPNASSPS